MPQFKIKHNDTRYNLIEMSKDDLILLKLDVEDDLAHVKNQIDEARAYVQSEGIYSDPEWYHKATAAQRIMGRNVQKINTVLSQRAKQERQERAASFEKTFINMARRLLAEETFSHLLEMTNEEMTTEYPVI